MPAVPRPGRSTFATVPLTAAAGVALVLLPFDYRQAMINSIIGIILALSLVIITGFVGQISVVQLGLAGVAGFTVSHLAFELGIGFPFGPILAVAAATGFGLATAVSALRVRGVSLAIVTLAAATALTQFGFANSIWGGGLTGSRVPEPKLFGLDLGPAAPWRGLDGNLPSPVFGFVALAAAVFLCLLTVGIRRAHLGQRMLAVRSNERAAAAAGIDVRTVKLAAFGISSFVAGVAGVLYAYNFGSVSGSRFDVFTALGLIAFAYVGGITMVSGALLAGLLSVQGLIPFALDDWFGLSGNYFLLFGGVMLLFTLVRNPEGIAGAMAKTMSTLKSRTGSREQTSGSGPTSLPVTSKASS
jgi:branched-chain amino acid transport system permease protein